MSSFRVISPTTVLIGEYHVDVERVPVKVLDVYHKNILAAFADGSGQQYKYLEPSLAILRQLNDFSVSSPAEDIDLFRSHLLYFTGLWHTYSVDQVNLKAIEIDKLVKSKADSAPKESISVRKTSKRHFVKIGQDGSLSVQPPVHGAMRTVEQLRTRINTLKDQINNCKTDWTNSDCQKKLEYYAKKAEEEAKHEDEDPFNTDVTNVSYRLGAAW